MYLELLSQEEKSTLCEIITGKVFKELFKNNEQEFSKIRKGFRAKSLTEQSALSIAKNNIDKPFIAMWVERLIASGFEKHEENIKKLEDNGTSNDDALATTILDSEFADHVDLYLKLAGKVSDEDACAKIRERIERIKYERIKEAEFADRIKDIENKNQNLSAQLEAAQKNAEDIKVEYEQKIQEIERDKNNLELTLTKANEQIARLQTAPTAITIEDQDYLENYDDTDISLLPTSDTDKIFSLCRVYSDYFGQKWLFRYADLEHDSYYYIFKKDDELQPHFTNRDKIFYKDGPSDEDFYGIWIWSAIPNENDPAKDYVVSNYYAKISPIEIVQIKEATSIDRLINILKKGIEYQLHSRKTMFAFTSNGQFVGILCNSKELNTDNGKITFAEDCIVVPVYEFSADNIMHLSNGLSFYKNAFAGLPNKLYHLKSPLDIVKELVLSSISWTAYKKIGTIHAEFREFKDFIEAIPVGDITRKIEKACRCSNPAAKDLLNSFLELVWKYVDGDSIDGSVILSAISTKTELKEKTKELVRKDWEAENEKLLTEAKNKLDLLNAELNSATNDLARAQEVLDQKKSEEERLAGIIAEKQKLAEDVEKEVAARIKKARENAADFIANMAFVSGQYTQGVALQTSAEAPSKYIVNPESESRSEPDTYHSWTDVINHTAYELEDAGVAQKYSIGLAAFLCAAYIKKQPVLLVGPNAVDIVQAFSAAVTGGKYGTLCCEGSYDNQTVAQIGFNGEKIVMVSNLFSSGWINRLPEIISQKDIFYIFIHPYAEDIQVEPKSLFGFMLPLFTEFFVDKKSKGDYYGGYFAEDFQAYSAHSGDHKELKAIANLSLSALVKTQLRNLVSTMRGIHSTMTQDDEFMFAVLPIAYATMEINELVATINDPQKTIALSAELKRDLKYILGEI